MAVFSFALLIPILLREPEAKLPPCCRRDGKHGCAMMAKIRQGESSGPALKTSVRCAAFPTGDATPATAKASPASPAVFGFNLEFTHAKAQPLAETVHRPLFRRSWQVRGPPTSHLT